MAVVAWERDRGSMMMVGVVAPVRRTVVSEGLHACRLLDEVVLGCCCCLSGGEKEKERGELLPRSQSDVACCVTFWLKSNRANHHIPERSTTQYLHKCTHASSHAILRLAWPALAMNLKSLKWMIRTTIEHKHILVSFQTTFQSAATSACRPEGCLISEPLFPSLQELQRMIRASVWNAMRCVVHHTIAYRLRHPPDSLQDRAYVACVLA